MPQDSWSAKRERQYEYIKEAEQEQGRSTKRAKEIAARTVNKEPPAPVRRKAERRGRPRGTSRRDGAAACAPARIGRRGGRRSSSTTKRSAGTSRGARR